MDLIETLMSAEAMQAAMKLLKPLLVAKVDGGGRASVKVANNKEECDDLRKETKGIITDLLKTPVNPPTDVSS